MPKASTEPSSLSLVVVAGAIFLFASVGIGAPLRAQETPRPSPREGPDTTCGPSYGSKPFGDSASASVPGTGRVDGPPKPGCPRVGEVPSPAKTPAPPANAQVTPLSPKADSLRQQADSTSRRP